MEFVTNSLTAAIGLGFVIFIHELGHFLLAKWNGVKVEKFSIGFGPTLLGYTRGETEYVLAAVPLGGFVKMLGEEPEEDSNKAADPRSFGNKTVGARMAIITAGVVMNVILGFGCFVWAYGRGGMTVTPAKLGGIVPGSPAYVAGLRPGDEIVGIDGATSNMSFYKLRLRVGLSRSGQKLLFDIRRPGRSEPLQLELEPRRGEDMTVPTIGIAPPRDLVLVKNPYEQPAGVTDPEKQLGELLKEGDKVVAVGPTDQEPSPVSEFGEFRAIMQRYRDKPLRVVLEHKPMADGKDGGKFSITVPPSHFLDFGFRPSISPIASVQRGSVAEQAGFRVGDRITSVNGKADFDPLRLADLSLDQSGKPMTFEVERPRSGQAAERLTLSALPDQSAVLSQRPFMSVDEPYDIPGLGLAYHVRPKVAAVTPDSPAAKAGIKVGDVINSIKIPDFKAARKKGEPIVFDKDKTDWSSAFLLLQLVPKGPVEMWINGSKKPIKVTPVADPTWFTAERGLEFDGLNRKMAAMSPSAALDTGFHDTIDNILQIYSMLRSLFVGRVSIKTVGGPFLIAEVAYSSAGSGFTHFVHFLGMLSINLAVLNFLPIPPLDGGQMVFLAGEKIRGKPLPEWAHAAGLYTGLALVLTLMVFVLCQDIIRVVTDRLF